MNSDITIQTEFSSTLTLLLTKVQREILSENSHFSNNTEEEVHDKLVEVEKFLRVWKKTENKFQLVLTEEIVPFFRWLWNNHKKNIIEYLTSNESTEFGFSKLPLLTNSEKEHHRKNFVTTGELWRQEIGETYTGTMSDYSTRDEKLLTHREGSF